MSRQVAGRANWTLGLRYKNQAGVEVGIGEGKARGPFGRSEDGSNAQVYCSLLDRLEFLCEWHDLIAYGPAVK